MSVARARVHCMRSTALGALSRGRNSTPAAATKMIPSHRTEVLACLFSGMAMVRPTLRVTLCQARRSATMRSAPTTAMTTAWFLTTSFSL
eukprot:2496976-Pleurochrysis_carterae.AAC.1